MVRPTSANYQRREALRWFVHQQHARIAHQRARDGEHLLLAAESEPASCSERSFNRGKSSNTRSRFQVRLRFLMRDDQILPHGQSRKPRRPLRHEADALARDDVGGEALHRLAEKAHGALRGGRKPMTLLMQVVLPAPLRPSNARTRPA